MGPKYITPSTQRAQSAAQNCLEKWPLGPISLMSHLLARQAQRHPPQLSHRHIFFPLSFLQTQGRCTHRSPTSGSLSGSGLCSGLPKTFWSYILHTEASEPEVLFVRKLPSHLPCHLSVTRSSPRVPALVERPENPPQKFHS